MADQATGMPVPSHAVSLYQTPAELASVAGAFIRAGFAAGEPVLAVLPRASLDLLEDALGAPESPATVIDMAEAGVNPGRLIPLMHTFAIGSPQPVRIVQEPAWASRTEAELAEVIVHEALLAVALDGRPAQVLCAYAAWLDRDTLARVAARHPATAGDSGWVPNQAYQPDGRAPGVLGLPLAAPPPGAATLTYRTGQSTVRKFSADQARQAGLSERRVVDVVIAIGELTGNTLAHTSGPGTLTTWASDGEFICQVSDSGELTNPLAGRIRPDPAYAGRGRGLWVAHQVADLLEVRSGPGGSTFRAHFRL